MDHLAAGHVPVYETPDEQRAVWNRCADRDQAVVAVRDASRGWIVRYDLQHLRRELSDETLQRLRDRVLDFRRLERRADGHSQTERIGGDVGPVSGEVHQPTEREARALASHLSELVFDERNRT
ncbi:hypothetical protein [Haloglomus salinum]|jgi:hypothetical protein|uniref:hypothetical protein n=1 Tax=Haloglomus salinum TaxID=2962673 RepID=UPI0020CA03CE|nr:hypothetical protein [Haloglomus salinum]